MGGGAGAVSRRRALQVLSVLLGSTDRRLEGLRGSHGGHRGAGVAGGEKTGGGPDLPTAALRRNSGAVGVRGRGQRLGELLGLEAELQRCSARAGRWRGRSSAEQGAAEQSGEGVAARVVGSRGSAGGIYRAAGRPWRARPGGESRRGLRRGSRAVSVARASDSGGRGRPWRVGPGWQREGRDAGAGGAGE